MSILQEHSASILAGIQLTQRLGNEHSPQNTLQIKYDDEGSRTKRKYTIIDADTFIFHPQAQRVNSGFYGCREFFDSRTAIHVHRNETSRWEAVKIVISKPLNPRKRGNRDRGLRAFELSRIRRALPPQIAPYFQRSPLKFFVSKKDHISGSPLDRTFIISDINALGTLDQLDWTARPAFAKDLLNICMEIANALDHLHRAGLSHTNLQMDNIGFQSRGNTLGVRIGELDSIEQDGRSRRANARRKADNMAQFGSIIQTLIGTLTTNRQEEELAPHQTLLNNLENLANHLQREDRRDRPTADECLQNMQLIHQEFVHESQVYSLQRPQEIAAKENRAIEATPQFNSYNIGDTQRSVTSLSLRPANLFLESLNVGQTTMPGGSLYRFIDPLETVLGRLNDLDENQVITVSCNGRRTNLYERQLAGLRNLGQMNLQDYFGNGRYNISVREIRQMLQSQRIHVSPLIPREFYLGVKNALIDDGIVTLPGNDGNPMSLHEARRTDTNLGRYLQRVVANPERYGFSRARRAFSIDEVMNLTLYQLGSMIVKTEDYHCFVGNGFQIADREVGDRDEIRLISACGIRGFYASSNIEGNRNHEMDQRIMKQTFKTAIESVGEGSYIIFPAVGMGVWRGDPNVYWRAFLDAVLELRVSPQKIFINPGHQRTHGGPYRGRTGDEFAEILRSYLDQHPENENLRKVVNLYRERTDLLLFAKNLKAEFPEKTVGIFNASDPDVTLGNHVGEYVNNRCHASTTEENFTALGSNGLCFEALTQVLAQPERVVQAR